LIKKYGSPYARFRLTGDTTDLAKGYEKMLDHLKVNFPLLTSEALFTDRVYLTADNTYDPADYARALLTGDEIQISASPYPSVSWEKCPDDLTVLVAENSPKSLIINLFLHSDKEQSATLRLWQLEKGMYKYTIDDHTYSFEIKERGQRFTFGIEPRIVKEIAIEKR
jgi:hypothetical protein